MRCAGAAVPRALTVPVSPIGLGTVQFGLPYGVSNRTGQVSRAAAARILAQASQGGIRHLDTAADYGTAEEVLAELLTPGTDAVITTKTPRFAIGRDQVLARVNRSLDRFEPFGLDTLLVHNAADLTLDGADAIWADLKALKAQGRVRRIGISCYIDDNPQALGERFAPDVIQAPLSILDQRLIESGQLAALQSRGIAVQARSLFLQGLIFMNVDQLPPNLQRHRDSLAAFHARLNAAGISPLVAAIQFARRVPGLDCCLVGVTTEQELADILAAASHPSGITDWRPFALCDPDLLNPARWAQA